MLESSKFTLILIRAFFFFIRINFIDLPKFKNKSVKINNQAEALTRTVILCIKRQQFTRFFLRTIL